MYGPNYLKINVAKQAAYPQTDVVRLDAFYCIIIIPNNVDNIIVTIFNQVLKHLHVFAHNITALRL